VANFVRRTMRFFRGKPHFESALYHYFRKGLKRVPNSGPCFSQATQITYIYKICLKWYKSILRAIVCHCFGYPYRNQWRTVFETDSRSG